MIDSKFPICEQKLLVPKFTIMLGQDVISFKSLIAVKNMPVFIKTLNKYEIR